MMRSLLSNIKVSVQLCNSTRSSLSLCQRRASCHSSNLQLLQQPTVGGLKNWQSQEVTLKRWLVQAESTSMPDVHTPLDINTTGVTAQSRVFEIAWSTYLSWNFWEEHLRHQERGRIWSRMRWSTACLRWTGFSARTKIRLFKAHTLEPTKFSKWQVSHGKA